MGIKSKIDKLKDSYSELSDQKIKDKLWNSYEFDRTMVKFVFDEPFYSYISCRVNKKKATKVGKQQLDTAGVTVENGKPILYYNEEYFNSLFWRKRQGLLKHEFLHLIFNHVTSRVKKINNKVDPAWFLSCDFSINSLIPEIELPEGGLIPGKWPKLSKEERQKYTKEQLRHLDSFREMIISWPKGESAEWYYEQICKNRESFDKVNEMNQYGTIDKHIDWDNLSSEEKDLLENEIQNIVRDAAHDCTINNNWGNVSHELKEIIRKMVLNKIDWKSLLKFFVGNSQTIHFSSTIKKICRRYPYVHPGKRRSRSARILIAIDQSGSMNQESLSLFFGELDSLAELTEFVVLPFDSKVIEDKIFTWKKGQKMSVERVACGGTDFNVPTQWANEHFANFDAVIFMTDGFCGKPIACKIPRAWIICPDGKLNFSTQELIMPMN
jgi:predicted metal-dependent peptidase